MGNVTKLTTTQLDTKIQALQSILHTNLISTWSLEAAQYDCYGRLYKTPVKDGYQLEAYDSNGEYTGNIFQNDVKAVMSFFTVGENRPINNQHNFTATVGIVFFVTIPELKSEAHRADEEVMEDVFNLLKKEPHGFRIINYITGVENVFEGLDFSKIKYDDMQPYLIFKFIMEVNHR